MARLYDREVKLTVSGGSGALDLSKLKIHFLVEQSTLQKPNPATIRIYNLTKQTALKIGPEKEYNRVDLVAGYVGLVGQIYSGNIIYQRIGRENPTDTFVDIYGGDGDEAYKNAFVNKTLPAGSTAKDVWDICAEALKQFGVKPGYVGPDLSQVKYTMAMPLYGSARNYLRELANTFHATWSVQNGEVQIIKRDSEGKPGTEIELNANTGLIGMPVETSGGIMVRSLIRPDLAIDKMLKINESSILRSTPDQTLLGEASITQGKGLSEWVGTSDGVYRIFEIKWTGDNFGHEWYADMNCIGKTGAATAALLGRGAGG